MRGVQGAAERAVLLAYDFLKAQDANSRVHDVQLDPRFQHRGVDLLWERSDGRVQGVEVKGDRNGRRGNYFFELISNLEKDTPGCFLYTTADVYLYAFLDTREVHALPMPDARDWFVPRAKTFTLKHVKTKTGAFTYTTVGAIVPCRALLADVPAAVRFKLSVEGAMTQMRRPRMAVRTGQ